MRNHNWTTRTKLMRMNIQLIDIQNKFCRDSSWYLLFYNHFVCMCTVFRLGVQYQMFTATPSIDASEHINPVVILYVYIYEKKKIPLYISDISVYVLIAYYYY